MNRYDYALGKKVKKEETKKEEDDFFIFTNIVTSNSSTVTLNLNDLVSTNSIVDIQHNDDDRMLDRFEEYLDRLERTTREYEQMTERIRRENMPNETE